jgi:hypothetical protein
MKIYIAIRNFEGEGEREDLPTASWSEQSAMDKARDRDGRSADWAHRNPVVRIGVFEIEEVK